MIKDYSSTDKTDISSFRNDLIGVIKRKDPLGNSTKWFCDNGGIAYYLILLFLGHNDQTVESETIQNTTS